MGFREVPVYEVTEVLRLWLGGQGLRSVEKLVGIDRKTVRRYVEAARDLGLERDAGEAQLSDVFIASVLERVRPHRVDGHGATWRRLEPHREAIKKWLDEDGLTVAKIHTLLTRQGICVPTRTLGRYCAELCGPRRGRSTTVRVADGEPGQELQVDFGRMGILYDPATDRRRVCHALIFTPCVSRYSFVWLTFSQTIESVIEGFEAAWNFFGGVFAVVIPDNMSGIVDKANPTEPRLNWAFSEYARSRGFLIDATRVRRPQDKPRVERVVPYVRRSFFAGEHFIDLADAQRRASEWCALIAGMRIHGTTACRPAEHFATTEAPVLAPVPAGPYDLPHYARPKVHRDHHVEVAKALYSVPGNLIGRTLEARADAQLVKLFWRGQLVKVHPRQAPGGRSSDPDDLPSHKSVYALRDLDRLRAMAENHGPAIGAYAAVILDHPLPWTKMRQVYALLALVKKWGPARRRSGLCPRRRGRGLQRLADRTHDRAGPRERSRPGPPPPGPIALGPLRPAARGFSRSPSKTAGP